MEKPKDKRKKQLNDYARYSGLAIQMGVIIGAGTWLGTYIDGRMENETPIFTIILSLISVAVGLYTSLKDFIKPE